MAYDQQADIVKVIYVSVRRSVLGQAGRVDVEKDGRGWAWLLIVGRDKRDVG